VIAISGPSGSGKTTLVKQVAALLGDATTLSYDDYRTVSDWTKDLRAWAKAGADPNQYVRKPQPFAQALCALRTGNAIQLPTTQTSVTCAPYIIVEEPWGRDREGVRSLIDFVAHIDIPLDVSLCRRLLRDAASGKNIIEFLKDYLEQDIRQVYVRQQKVAENADLILDGMQSAEMLARQIVARVLQQKHVPTKGGER
jgi:uridine kinase